MKDNTDTKKPFRDEPYYDQPFKQIMSDGVLTSNILGEFVEELRGKDPESILSCLNLTEEKKIRMRNSESPSAANGPIYRDIIYDVNIPGEKEIKVIVNLEAQLDPNPGYPLEARAMYYLGRAISDQKAEIGYDYSKLSKVYSIWFVMEPQKGMSNTITRHRMVGSYDEGFESPAGIGSCDYAEIVMVHLGKFGDKGLTTLGLLNTVFSKYIGKEERIRRLEEDYKIVLDTSIFDEVEELMVNLDEDYKRYMERLGREEGLKKGLAEGRKKGLEEGRAKGLAEGRAEGRAEGIAEGRQEERTKTVGILADTVREMMRNDSSSFDTAFDKARFPDEYREDVRLKVQSASS